jgi:hypothetical protein
MTFNIEWRSNIGYGDFITGLGYAHSATLKYQRPVHINFHWPHAKDIKQREDEPETLYERFNHILDYMKPVDNLTISHTWDSVPEWRFINELEEFNPLHGLWYPKQEPPVEKGLVVHWSSRHNLKFPGYHKDPVYDHWPAVVDKIKSLGYNVVEVTYRTPIIEVMDLMYRCEFGIGYEGMIHQLFKFLWKPTIIASQRYDLTRLLAIQATIVSRPEHLLDGSIIGLVNNSKRRIQKVLADHKKYMQDIQDPTKHRLYDKPI